MKGQIYSLATILMLSMGLANAQDFNDYQTIESKGEIPRDFLLLASEKVEVERGNTISDDEKRSTRKTKEQFLVGSNFMINRLLGSGRVLFNDPVSDYLNEVMANILEHQPDLKYKVRVYAVKSSSVNAFATNDGIIMVNVGLLAQLETEAQLAYILCHELTHFQKKHVLNVYLENDQIEKGKGAYRGTSLSERLISSSNYSKEIETEADMDGLSLFLNTDYSTESLDHVFDVLHYAYLPFDDIEFEKSFFESDYLVFPPELFLEEVAGFSPFEEEDDSRSSHPSTFKRKIAVSNKLEDNPGKGTKNYLTSKEKFETVRKMCRYELSNLYLNNEDYEMAVYNSYMLLKSNPGSKYLKKNITKALYCLSKYSNSENFYSVHTRYKKIEGSAQQLYHLFEKMTVKERNALALRYAWLARQEFPEDEDLKRISDDLMESLVNEHYSDGFFREHMSDEEKAEIVEKKLTGSDSIGAAMVTEDENDEQESDEEEDEEEANKKGKGKKLSKYDKIKKQRKEEGKDGKGKKGDYIRFAFVDLYDNEDFKAKMDKFIQERPEEESDEMYYKGLKAEAKKERKISRHGYALGIEKTVIVSPYFMKLDLRKDEQVRYEKSEKAMLDFYEKIKQSSGLMSLETDLIAIPQMDLNSVDQFNDLAFLNNWIDARLTHMDQEIVDMDTEKLKELSDRYGTKYFTWTGVLSFRKSNNTSVYNLCLGILFYPYLPFAIAKMVKPNYETYFYCITFDFETGEPVMTVYNQFNQGDAQDYINVNVYDALYQLKSQRK